MFILEIPAVELSYTNAQICGKAEPTQIRSEKPSSNVINLAPDINQISDQSCKCDYVNSGCHRASIGEKERHKELIETQLNSIEGCAMLDF